MIKPISKFFISSLAIKDGLRHKTALSILASCCVIACAALLAILSLKENISDSIDKNSKSLLGADFIISTRIEPDENTNSLIKKIKSYPKTQIASSEEISFASMVYFPKSSSTRLVQINAVSNPYPLYGVIETTPEGLTTESLKNFDALLDYSLKAQFNLEIGNKIQIGKNEFFIKGFITGLPGSTETRASLAPRLIIPLSELDSINLIKKGSIVRYNFLFKLNDPKYLNDLVKSIEDDVKNSTLNLETFENRAENLKKNIEVVYRFFDSATIISLLLGIIGFWSGGIVFLRNKSTFIETLYLLGFTKKEIIYYILFQIISFGLVGIILGCSLGILIQYYLPEIISSYTPVDIPFSISLKSLVITSITGLFSLIATSFSAYLLSAKNLKDNKLFKFIFLPLLTIIFIFLLLLLISSKLFVSLIYTLSAILIFTVLFLTSSLLRNLAKRLSNKTENFSFSMGIKNLYRPNNQTLTLLVAVSISCFSILFVYFLVESSTRKLELLESEGDGNLLVFDIQEDQIEDLRNLLNEHKLPIISQVPLITMRMIKINNTSITEIKNSNKDNKIPEWVFNREYRSSYKSSLEKDEIILEGEFIGKWNGEGKIPISVESGIAEKLKLKLDDVILFSIQGIEIETIVKSIRKVNWQQFKPNFFILFPEGALEGAPTSSIILSKYSTQLENAKFQNEAVNKFGNISIIDLELVLSSIKKVSNQLKNSVLFLGLLIASSSFIILFGIIISSRTLRLEENVLLRTLGIKKSALFTILFCEYLALGTIASFSALTLSFISAKIFLTFVLKSELYYNPIIILVILMLVVIIVSFLGFIGSIGTIRRGAIKSYRLSQI